MFISHVINKNSIILWFRETEEGITFSFSTFKLHGWNRKRYDTAFIFFGITHNAPET